MENVDLPIAGGNQGAGMPDPPGPEVGQDPLGAGGNQGAGVPDPPGAEGGQDPPGAEGGQDAGAEGGQDGELRPSILCCLFYDLWLFFLPQYEKIKGSSDGMTRMFNYFETVWFDWLSFFKEHPNGFWNIKGKEILDKGRAYRQKALDYFRSGEPAFQLLFKIFSESHTVLKKSLLDLQQFHDYIAVLPPGIAPSYEIQIDANVSLRDLCFRMNVNLMQRMYYSSAQFLIHAKDFFLSAPEGGMAELRQLEAPEGDAPVAPAGDAPGVDAPVVPEGDAPVVPGGDAPRVDAPVVPEVDGLAGDAPVVPGGDAPGVDAPVVPAGDAPVVPGGDVPGVDAPVVPGGDAPGVDAPVAPAGDAPVVPGGGLMPEGGVPPPSGHPRGI